VQAIIDARQMRAKFLDSSLFADPAWSILLDLYRASLAHHRISTTSLCFGAGVPLTTALRWLVALEERGLATRSQDPLDARRQFVSLTDDGIAAMSRYFNAVAALPL
jgi:DNA-binding MarR family transcriptional regulator